MFAYKLEKPVTLYKSQFDKLLLSIHHDYRLDRTSLDLDAILFRIKYMISHRRDLHKLEFYKAQFIEGANRLRSLFGDFLKTFLIEILHSSEEDIEDILVEEVKMDPVYVRFRLILISTNVEYLKTIDEKIPDDVFNIYPNEYFRFFSDSYNDGIAKAYPELFSQKHIDVGVGEDGDVFCHSFTFQTTERCSCNCTYCYQSRKSPMRMSFDTAKVVIDNLLHDNYSYINRFNSPAIIIEFIGGEPLLEIDLTRRIYEYFLDQCYELDHPWFQFHRLSICSNGLQYFNPKVQSFFKDYHHNISFNISIDGNKELHDSCRIQPNGEGTYDIDKMALDHYTTFYAPEKNSKMTLAPSNIRYLYDSVVDFINNGMRIINLNCVFEEGWNQKTAREEYFQLKKLADYLVENNLEHIYIAIFRERPSGRQSKSFDGNFCGGLGSILALRANGQFYPCLRYMPSSVGDDVADLCIGDIRKGLIGRQEGSPVLKMMDSITRRSQSNDICYDCPLGTDCAWCSAHSHSVYGTPEKRATFTCIQMIAESLANVYYWNRLNLAHPEYQLGVRKNVVPDEWALLVIDNDELSELKLLECISMVTTMERSLNLL